MAASPFLSLLAPLAAEIESESGAAMLGLLHIQASPAPAGQRWPESRQANLVLSETKRSPPRRSAQATPLS